MAEACQNPVTVICIRSLAAAVINAHLAIRLLALHRKGSAHFEHKTFIECKKWMSNGFTIIETAMAIAKHWKMSGIDLAAASKRNTRRISTESTDTSRINSLSFTFRRDGSSKVVSTKNKWMKSLLFMVKDKEERGNIQNQNPN
jgi:hypothetical protein